MGVPGYRRYPQRKIWEKNPIFGGTAVPPTVLEGLGLVGNVFFFFFFFLSARRGANLSIAAIIGGKYASVGSLPFREKEKVAYRAPAAQNL